MLDYKPNMVLSNEEFRVVGTRPVRHDGVDKVTGRARYAADTAMPGLLYARVVRSPHAHARILSIDASRALALPGVHAVVTAADFPEASAEFVDQEEGAAVNYGFFSRNIMAREKALYMGHAVAAVAATSQHLADEAAALIDVDYEVLPPVITASDADGGRRGRYYTSACSLWLVRRSAPVATATATSRRMSPTTSCSTTETSKQGFAEADVIVEREFHTKAVHQGYIEPHSATAFWNRDDKLTVWCSTQQLFAFRDHISAVLNIPLANVQVIPMEIGGGFGGKGMGGLYLEPVVSMLSRKAARPVKLAMSRKEVFEGSGPTSATHITVKMGATREGKLTAADATLIYEAGAFPGSPVPSGCRTMLAPYVIPNVHVEGLDVVVNTQKSAAYRASRLAGSSVRRGVGRGRACEQVGHRPHRVPPAERIEGGHAPARGPRVPAYRQCGDA